MKLIYISGPMTGIQDLNRKSFKNAYFRLKEGNNVINPHDIGDFLHIPKWIPSKISWWMYIIVDVIILIFCRKIYMLEGWEKSSGAKVELRVAKILKMEVEYEDLGKPFNLGCEKCGEQFEGYFNNFPYCPRCGETENIQWALKSTHTHLVSDPEKATVENMQIQISCSIKLPK